MEDRMKVLIAYDGSAYADAALDDLRRAGLPREAVALIVSVGDGLVSTSTPMADIQPRLEELYTGSSEGPPVNAHLMAEGARVVLLDEGLNASVVIREGDPRRVLIDEAREWAADSIFVGSHGLDHPDERSGLGSVSAALVTNATCSVEVVRS